MRLYLQTAALFLGAASLICFGSCERHKPGELEHGDLGPDPGASEQAATEAAPHASATPAQFFPSPTP